MRTHIALTFGVLIWGVAMAIPAGAQPYDARRHGDIVQLEDKASQTVVTIGTSVGNVVPIHGFRNLTDQWQVVELKHDGTWQESVWIRAGGILVGWIGDPTPLGWVTVMAYLVAAWLSHRVSVGPLRQAGHAGSGAWRERLLWRVLVVILVVLAINKQLDLQSTMTDALRVLAREQGWYRFRRDYQAAFIEALAVVAVAGVGGLVAFTWKMPRGVKIAALGLTCLTVFVLLRAASFHHADALFARSFLSVRLNKVIELGGVGVVALGAVLRLVKSRGVTPSWGRRA